MTKAGLLCHHCGLATGTVECFVCGKPTCEQCTAGEPGTTAGRLCLNCAGSDDLLKSQRQIYRRHGRGKRDRARLHRQQKYKPGTFARARGKR